jgi:hypothetical protein
MSTIPETLKTSIKSLNQRGEKNSYWVGDKVKYKPLHRWVRRNSAIPKTCQTCNLEKRLDAANISQKYLRDLSDWKWLCRSCHMKEDGRMKNLWYVTPKSNRKCSLCDRPHKAKGLCDRHYGRYQYSCSLRRNA